MKVCVVGPVVEPLRGTHMLGGAERQMLLLAGQLAARGHDVTCVEPGYDGPPEHIKGVEVRSGWEPGRGARVVRYLSYRLPTLRRTLREVAADVYYTRGFELYSPTVVGVARAVNAVSIVGLAHDTDLQSSRASAFAPWRNPDESLFHGRLALWYFRSFALRRATWVVAQTMEQLQRARALGLSCEIIPNIVDMPSDSLLNCPETADMIWVGYVSRRKGIDKLLELARTLSDVQIQIVGPFETDQLESTTRQLRALPNVTWTDELPHDRVLETISEAKVLVNTSPQEGFANVLLEAWALGKPVVTLNVDPNGLLSGDGSLGECARGDLNAMRDAVLRYVEDPALRRLVGERARRHVLANCSPDSVCAAFERLASQAPPGR